MTDSITKRDALWVPGDSPVWRANKEIDPAAKAAAKPAARFAVPLTTTGPPQPPLRSFSGMLLLFIECHSMVCQHSCSELLFLEITGWQHPRTTLLLPGR